MQNPTVAVLIATYNGEQFLKEQLESIFFQTYTNFKIYLSDDASSDSTIEILKYYKAKYPQKVFYSVNEKNIGFVKNFEKLLLACTEEYVALSDQDDIWYSNKLQKQMEVMFQLKELNENLPLMVHSDLEVVDANLKKINDSYFRLRSYKLKEEKDLGHILGPSGVMGNTILMNQKLLHCVLPFPEKLDVHDYWIGVKCEFFGKRKTIFEPLVRYRIHEKNYSNKLDKLIKKSNYFFWLDRDIKLPNMETNRKLFLPDLIPKISNKKDLDIINAYLDYLEFNKNRVRIYFLLLKYSLVKRDLFFRVKLFFKTMWTKRY